MRLMLCSKSLWEIKNYIFCFTKNILVDLEKNAKLLEKISCNADMIECGIRIFGVDAVLDLKNF